MSGDRRSLYEVLRLQSGATNAEVKEAYRAAALLLHPDKGGGGSDADFRRLQAAWEVLKDPVKRAAYDRRAAATDRRTAVAEELDLDDLTCTLVSSSEGDRKAENIASVLSEGYDGAPHSTGSVGGSRQLHRFQHPCRCGGVYAVDEDELPEDAEAVLIQCSTCSLVVRVCYLLGAQPA